MNRRQLEEFLAGLEHMSPADLIEQKRKVEALQRKLADAGPQTDEELHAWVVENIGIDIPRHKVCPDHDEPFSFLADLYFNRVTSALLMANRGGSKTFIVALLHYLNATYKPGYWGLSFGATEAQSDRCYEHLTGWVYTRVKQPDGAYKAELRRELEKSIEKRTLWKNGSKVEIVVGTKKAVNGPHPQVAHADEVEQIDEEAWEESRNMAIAGITTDGRQMPAQDVLTSTRKTARGRMQQLIDVCEEAERDGLKPPYRVYKWCCFETTAEVPHCREAPDEERRARLEELGKDPCEVCDCNIVMGKGRERDGSKRTLDKTCRGRFFRSRGWRPLDEVQNTFQQNGPGTWHAQQECSRPETEGNYVEFDESHHIVYAFVPDPLNGPIYMSVDWGGTNPHAVNWYQRLDYATEVLTMSGGRRTIPQDSFVVFDEIYKAEIPTSKLAALIKAKEAGYRAEYPGWRVAARFADPQGKADRLEFKGQGLRTTWPVGTRDFDYMVTRVQDTFDEDRFYVACDRRADDRCPMFIAEIGEWRKDPKTGNQIDEFNHCMSNLRYCVANVDRLDKREERRKRSAVAAGRVKTVPGGRRKPAGRKHGRIGLAAGTGGHVLDAFSSGSS